MPLLLRGAGLGAAVLLPLTACGGSSTSTTNPAPATSPAAPTPVATSAAAASSAVPVGSPAPAESNPPGDIPDTVAYVPFTLPGAPVTFTHPEGWAQTTVTGGVRFTDKLNSVTVTVAPGAAPTVARVRRDLVPVLASPALAPTVTSVATVTVKAGPAVKVVWRVNSAPDPVTGRTYRDEVETFLVGHSGSVVRMDLAGAVGSDNVDPYKVMTDSLALS